MLNVHFIISGVSFSLLSDVKHTSLKKNQTSSLINSL